MLTADAKKIIEVLNKQFQSVFTFPLGNMQISKPEESFSTAHLHVKEAAINYVSIKEENVTI